MRAEALGFAHRVNLAQSVLIGKSFGRVGNPPSERHFF